MYHGENNKVNNKDKNNVIDVIVVSLLTTFNMYLPAGKRITKYTKFEKPDVFSKTFFMKLELN